MTWINPRRRHRLKLRAVALGPTGDRGPHDWSQFYDPFSNQLLSTTSRRCRSSYSCKPLVLPRMRTGRRFWGSSSLGRFPYSPSHPTEMAAKSRLRGFVRSAPDRWTCQRDLHVSLTPPRALHVLQKSITGITRTDASALLVLLLRRVHRRPAGCGTPLPHRRNHMGPDSSPRRSRFRLSQPAPVAYVSLGTPIAFWQRPWGPRSAR